MACLLCPLEGLQRQGLPADCLRIFVILCFTALITNAFKMIVMGESVDAIAIKIQGVVVLVKSHMKSGASGHIKTDLKSLVAVPVSLKSMSE